MGSESRTWIFKLTSDLLSQAGRLLPRCSASFQRLDLPLIHKQLAQNLTPLMTASDELLGNGLGRIVSCDLLVEMGALGKAAAPSEGFPAISLWATSQPLGSQS